MQLLIQRNTIVIALRHSIILYNAITHMVGLILFDYIMCLSCYRLYFHEQHHLQHGAHFTRQILQSAIKVV